jgi:hypothetical protein
MTTKNWLLSEFKKYSSSELSFRRRTASITLLDALCELTQTDAKSLFNSDNNDWFSLLQLHRSNHVVITFMLHNDINPKNNAFSEKEKETITWCLMELIKHLKKPREV